MLNNLKVRTKLLLLILLMFISITGIAGFNIEKQDESLVKILNFLNDWLIEHILKTDKLIVQ